jgi:hypothetical protein
MLHGRGTIIGARSFKVAKLVMHNFDHMLVCHLNSFIYACNAINSLDNNSTIVMYLIKIGS